MLTKDQLDAALTEIENGATSDATLTTVRWLAIAHVRVVALLARYDSDPGRGSTAWDECVKPWVDDVRRALEG